MGRPPDFTSHRLEAQEENLAWLMSPRGGSLSLELACRRVGLTVAAYEKRLQRASTNVTVLAETTTPRKDHQHDDRRSA